MKGTKMEKKKPTPKKTVTVIFVVLIILTVAAAAAAIIDDLVMISRGMYERKGLEELFYFVVVAMALFSVAVEINLLFDLRYFVTEKEKKQKYKTVFHTVATALVGATVLCVVVSLIRYIYLVEIALFALAAALGVTRLAHLIVYLVMHGKEKKDNNISKEIDTQ